MKRILLVLLVVFLSQTMFAQQVATYQYAQKDTYNLMLDIYYPTGVPRACIVYMFGGGFMMGSRLGAENVEYFKALQDSGFQVVAIDYRLALKGQKLSGIPIKQIHNAIMIASEDLYSAVAYLIEPQQQLKIDTSKIVLIGSSAGAVSVMQSEYMLCRRMELSKVLPENFNFAGVVSFSGAIFSREGLIDYINPPCPVFMLHGTEDKLVTYKSITFFNLGFFGANAIAKRFKKFGYPYQFYRYQGCAHEVAGLPLLRMNETIRFIEDYVLNGSKLQLDAKLVDKSVPKFVWGRIKPSQMRSN